MYSANAQQRFGKAGSCWGVWYSAGLIKMKQSTATITAIQKCIAQELKMSFNIGDRDEEARNAPEMFSDGFVL